MISSLGKRIFPSLIWDIPAETNSLYLTFDDGPVPEVTPFVLDVLKQYKAKATFFCVGENVNRHPIVFRRITDEGHAIGNHTQHHLNGWKTKNDIYLNDVESASTLIHSNLFRPPYGKLRPSQYLIINRQYSIVMWDVLSKDYDKTMTGEQCLQRVMRKAKPGSIIVFHDSIKAFDRLQYALPKVLEHFTAKGFSFKDIHL